MIKTVMFCELAPAAVTDQAKALLTEVARREAQAHGYVLDGEVNQDLNQDGGMVILSWDVKNPG